MNLTQLLANEFDSDFEVLLTLPVNSQIIIFKKINPDIDSLFIQGESLNEIAFNSIVSHLAQKAKDRRNQAIRRGATDKTDIDWMSAALLEHTYNSILSGDESVVLHISRKLSGWMQGIEMIDLGMESKTKSNPPTPEIRVINCPSCKAQYKVPTQKHIEVTCKKCSFKWKIYT